MNSPKNSVKRIKSSSSTQSTNRGGVKGQAVDSLKYELGVVVSVVGVVLLDRPGQKLAQGVGRKVTQRRIFFVYQAFLEVKVSYTNKDLKSDAEVVKNK